MCFIEFKGTTNGSKTKDLKIKCSLIIFKETILVKKWRLNHNAIIIK